MDDLQEIFRKHKICVLVPTYNNAQTLRDVLSGISSYTREIIVVNDGSTDDTLNVLNDFSHLKVITYAKNKGKGFALRAGFKKAVISGYDYAITIDSDGQHDVDDLKRFAESVRLYPDAIVIGARNMDQASVPGRSSFGNKFSNFWFWVETGIRRSDTQSGYRLYPIRLLSGLDFYTRKFEFEIEVLVRSAWAGVHVEEVPVNVYYPRDRVSHFRPFRDFTRISFLNTVLVAIALLYIKPRNLIRSIQKKNFRQILKDLFLDPSESDSKKAISAGFGIFMGIVPIWGFQLVVAISLAFLFKMNKALVILAANISVPPLIPLILYVSYVTGKVWMGENAQDIVFTRGITFEMIESNFLQYVTGAITLAVICGVVFGLATFLFLKISNYRQSSVNT